MLHKILEQANRDFTFSGYQVSVSQAGRVLDLHGGVTSWWPTGAEVTATTWFDIGSVTKPVVGASLAAIAVGRGQLDLEGAIGDWIPDLRSTKLAQLSTSQLLSHLSGLKAWVPFFRDSKGVLAWIAENAPVLLETEPGTIECYSDVGFWLLGAILEKVYKCDLASAFDREVRKPLGLEATAFSSEVSQVNCAATEYCLWRRRLLQGEVFDENCAAMGGVAAHAGLFSTASSLRKWAEAWLACREGKSDWISQAVAWQFTQRTNGRRFGLGWDHKASKDSFAGQFASADTFGHLGFPGASVWIDPEVKGCSVILTNRIHPSRLNTRHRKVSAAVNDVLAEAWRSGSW